MKADNTRTTSEDLFATLTADEKMLIRYLVSLKIRKETIEDVMEILYQAPEATLEMLNWVHNTKPNTEEILLKKLFEIGNKYHLGDYPTQNT